MKSNNIFLSFYRILHEFRDEFKTTTGFVLPGITAVLLSYSVYLFFSESTIAALQKEDGFFEWGTFIFFFGASVTGAILFYKTRNFFFMLLALVLFFAAGEEISWGQRIIGFATPEKVSTMNLKNEFNVHNLAVFSSTKAPGMSKHGLERLLEINFLFRVCTIIFGILLPLLVYGFKGAGRLARLIKLPVPPISIGMFFFINRVVFWAINYSVHFSGNYDLRQPEIFEFLAAFILFLIMFYFYFQTFQPAHKYMYSTIRFKKLFPANFSHGGFKKQAKRPAG